MRKAFASLSAVMARPASDLAAALARPDVVPLRRMLARVRDWRYGMGVGREKHRCFVAVDEAYASPWFTSVPEDRKSTRLNSSHSQISYAVFCLKKKTATT